MLGRVWSPVSRCVSRVVDRVKTAGAKAWNAVTGKDKFLEAKRLHEELMERYQRQQQLYREQVEARSQAIEGRLKAINGFKQQIFDSQFPRFIALGNRLHNVRVAGSHFEEFFDNKLMEVACASGVRSRAELFEIDFDNLGFREVALSVLTLGFYSRRRAKESLQQVKDEAVRIEEEFAKMEAQLAKIAVVEQSIGQVELYFDQLIANYGRLLDRFEYGINSQRILQLGMDPQLFAGKLDFRLLPVAHIQEFQALFNLSVVLKRMAQMSYLSRDGAIIEGQATEAAALFDRVAAKEAA
ncbi:DNA repair protein [Ferrimonas sediminicola]|uniref:DNA repair protein n=1 Tax=Ferrimonas sediminicola TaxID=2569538 RepID=A0A4U1BBT5_9GAMM|nr:DNA repair protein [Ferrimonas sediminicola]TKB48448.1 DNA repair protein [Ferrimonas sediminicola]